MDNIIHHFKIKTLNLKYLEEIHNLLSNHYIEDDNNIIRLIYSKDFLYWYLKKVPDELIIGLIYKNKLVGLITAIIIDVIISKEHKSMPYVNLFCLQKKIRKLGLSKLMIDELKIRLQKMGMTDVIYATMKQITNYYCIGEDFIIPINYHKLKKINFIDIIQSNELEYNPLQLMEIDDIKIIRDKLNIFLSKYLIHPYFTQESIQDFFLSKKNIVYSFVIRNINNIPTDFISIYKHYYYCIEKNEMLSVAQLTFYYYETVTLTQLVKYLIDKLLYYNIDQIVINNIMDNMEINITKYTSYRKLYYGSFNPTDKINNKKLSFFIF